METILKFDKICYSYHTPDGEVEALKDLSFSLSPGEFISIVGPSGCGKSTLLSLISGLILPESGQITLKDNAHIGYMLQRDNLLEWRSVYNNIILGLEIQKKLSADYLTDVDDMINTYGLSQFKNSLPSQLSGGMRQRASLIRTLALKPEILLLDEPFSALDYQTRLEVSDDIGKIIKKEKKTALLVTHDISEAISMGDRIIILSHRPGTIKKIINVNITDDNNTPFNRRFTPEFKDLFNEIWKELK